MQGSTRECKTNAPIIDDYSYVFKKGEKIGIVGPNGVGKSTFLNIITEKIRPTSGRVVVGQTIQFGYYTQAGMTAPDDRRVIDLVKDIAEEIELEIVERGIHIRQIAGSRHVRDSPYARLCRIRGIFHGL